MAFVKVHILQMEKEHLGFIAVDKITSMHSITMVQPAPDSTEEDPKTVQTTVTVVNIAGQPPVFVKESPRMLLCQIKKGDLK